MKRLFLLGVISFFSVAGASAPEYSKELLLAYFPEPFVTETLARFQVPKEEWAPIAEELTAQDERVINLVEEKANKMFPNPMQDPSQRQVAVKMFREVLFQVFSDVMHAHGVKDNDKIKEMLDSIQQLKAERFSVCMRGQKYKGTPSEPISFKEFGK